MMRSRLIEPSSLLVGAAGMQLNIRLPWYRTLPLSVIDLPRVTVDGVDTDPASVTLSVNGGTFDQQNIRLATEIWWYVLDPATLRVGGVNLSPGAEYRITVAVSFAPPYIPEISLFCAATQAMTANDAPRPT